MNSNLGYSKLIYLKLINSKCHSDKSLGDISNLCIQGSLLGDSKSVFLRHKNHLPSYQFMFRGVVSVRLNNPD